eukprot:1182431-Amphidinium_carterae.1
MCNYRWKWATQKQPPSWVPWPDPKEERLYSRSLQDGAATASQALPLVDSMSVTTFSGDEL